MGSPDEPMGMHKQVGCRESSQQPLCRTVQLLCKVYFLAGETKWKPADALCAELLESGSPSCVGEGLRSKQQCLAPGEQ